MSAEETSTRFRVEGMDCASCANKIDTAVRRLPGVEDVSVSVVAGTLTLGHKGADLAQVQQKVTDLGYRISALTGATPKPTVKAHDHDHGDHDHDHDPKDKKTDALEGLHGHDHAIEDGPWWKTAKAQLTIFCGVAVAAAFVLARFLPQWHNELFILAMLVGLLPIFRRARIGMMNGSPFSIETLMTVAAVGAVFI
ncbi:MAG: heavy metal translocating P-type ATPase, partial [Hyphomicrobiales bacterium]